MDEQLTVDLKDYADQIEEILTEKKNVTSQKNIILNQNFKDLAPKVYFHFVSIRNSMRSKKFFDKTDSLSKIKSAKKDRK